MRLLFSLLFGVGSLALPAKAIGSPATPQFVLYGSDGLLVDASAQANGDVGVEHTASNLLTVSLSAQVNGATYGDIVVLLPRARVGNVFASQLINLGGSYLVKNPLPPMPSLPALVPINPGTKALNVVAGKNETLAATSLGAVTVGRNAKLSLTGGLYQFASLDVEDGGEVEALAAVDLRIAGSLTTEGSATLAPAVGTAKQLSIEVAGSDQRFLLIFTTPAVSLSGTVRALLLAPNGSVVANANVTGAVFAKQLELGAAMHATLEDGFGVCAPGATQCTNDTQQETCTWSGQWSAPATCADACVGTRCGGVCVPGTMRCDPNSNGVDTCSVSGQWSAAVACNNQACVSGACTGVCAPGATQCDPTSDGADTCTASGQWSAAVACNNQACVSGACTGVCAPGAIRCDPNSNGMDTCGASGQWSAAVACNNQACVSGACTGVCAPGAIRCDPNSNGVDTCSASGQWSAAVACNNQACLSGATGAPDPGACTGGTQLLPGHAPVGIGNLPVVSALPPSTQLTLGIALPLTNQAALENLIAELGNPSSAQFHQYLTPAQFADSFGASKSDYNTLVSFVQSSGLTVTRSYAGRNMLEATGTVAAIESTFFVQLNVYKRADGTTFYAPVFDPSVNLNVPLRFITGLDNYAVAKPALCGTVPKTCYSGSVSSLSWYSGTNLLRSAYVPCATGDGTGQTIGIVAIGSYYPNDISDYTTFFGMPSANITVVPVPTTASPSLPALNGGSCASYPYASSVGPGCLASPALSIPSESTTVGGPWSVYLNAQQYEVEVAQDIEMALAIAPGATIMVYEQDPMAVQQDLILSEMADDDVAQQISSSFFWYDAVPHSNIPDVFEQFAVQGQSFFFSSGDEGAYNTNPLSPVRGAPDPGIDSPYMTVVGGTSLSTTGTCPATYSSETTWSGSGGGFYTGWTDVGDGITQIRPTLPIPSYQTNVNPSNSEVTSNPQHARMVPDVSMAAVNLLIYSDSAITNSSTYSAYDPILGCGGGTSASAPLWAGITALINQQSTIGNLGFANEQLYAIAAAGTASYSSNFHDIADNSNNDNGGTGADHNVYHAVAGYDLATGLGSPTCSLLTTAGSMCEPGTMKCVSYTQQETCTTSHQWGAPMACAACVGTECQSPIAISNSCALLSGDGVKCWGENQYGQLGNGTTTNSLTPVPVTGLLSGVTAISAGDGSACALLSSGTVACWGDNDFGVLGTGSTTGPQDCYYSGSYYYCSTSPVDVTGLVLSGVTAISAGDVSACALLSGGTVECWGLNDSGELGDGTTGPENCGIDIPCSTTPVTVTGLSGVTAISTGHAATCALLSSGTVQCWGYNAFGVLGNGTTTDSLTPVAVTGLSGVTAISAGESSACALLSGGTVTCWGSNTFGELGTGNTTDSLTPAAVTGLSGVTAISAGFDFACALLSGGTVTCWGDNNYGQLGNGTTTNSSTPVPVTGLNGVTAISAGDSSACALLSGGTVECWGFNLDGELGNGTTANSSMPVTVVW